MSSQILNSKKHNVYIQCHTLQKIETTIVYLTNIETIKNVILTYQYDELVI